MRGLLLWVAVAAVFWVVVLVLPGFEAQLRGRSARHGPDGAAQRVLWPLLIRIVLPLTVLTFGLGSLVLNAAIVVARDQDRRRRRARLPRARSASAFLLSLALMLLTPALSFDDDARQLRIVRRRARAASARRTAPTSPA